MKKFQLVKWIDKDSRLLMFGTFEAPNQVKPVDMFGEAPGSGGPEIITPTGELTAVTWEEMQSQLKTVGHAMVATPAELSEQGISAFQNIGYSVRADMDQPGYQAELEKMFGITEAELLEIDIFADKGEKTEKKIDNKKWWIAAG